ncbi:helix-turn-helix domain-containing protein [Streptomyces sp. NPDC007025]|uniref:helix-turn-helix domain-containing protein n=1 Tax=Streptomyces sp. NPDC007025 TaxID=3364771 RepID=UPI0036A53AA8
MTATPVNARADLPAHYLTPHDVAELLRVPLETVYGWRKKRIGPPAFRVGKHLRYDPAAVRTYLRDLAQQQNPAA